MLADEGDHAEYVDAWLRRVAAEDLPRPLLAQLFERALGALWRRANVTLGEVTLRAILDRVFYAAAEQYPVLTTLTVEPTGIQFDAFLAPGGADHERQLPEIVRFVLVEVLTVLGNLTAEILTPALHEELSKVAGELRSSQEPSS